MLKAGDEVVCVDGVEPALRADEAYTIARAVGDMVCVRDRSGKGSGGWHASRFRRAIPISDIPEGWEVVRIGVPKGGEWYYNYYCGYPIESMAEGMNQPRIILRRAGPVNLGTLKAGDRFAFDDTADRKPGVQVVVDKRHVKGFGDEVCYFSPSTGFGSACASVKVHPIGVKP